MTADHPLVVAARRGVEYDRLDALADELQAEADRIEAAVTEMARWDDPQVAADLDEIAGMVTADQLLPRCHVRLAGEWVSFLRLDADGNLVVAKVGSCMDWTYPVTAGERFVWSDIFG